jgi:hypothetical protein
VIRMGLLVAAAAAAAVLLNVLLLGRATGGNDPVGRLQPRMNAPGTTTTTKATTIPKWTLRPTTTDEEQNGPGLGSDD